MTPAARKARIASLEQQLQNFERLKLTEDARRIPLVAELEQLQLGALTPETSLRAIRVAAEARDFISYGQLAEASNLPWAKARLPMPKHLDDLCIGAHSRGWPLITAIVVEGDNVASGRLGEKALRGFCVSATRLGYDLDGDAMTFLHRQQQAVFDWAAKERGNDLRY